MAQGNGRKTISIEKAHHELRKKRLAIKHFESPEVQKLVESACEKAIEQFSEGSSYIDVGIMSEDGDFQPTGSGGYIESYTVPGGEIVRDALTTSIHMKSVDSPPSRTGGSQQLTEDEIQRLGDRYGVIKPPWKFSVLKALLLQNPVHAAIIETKAADYAYSGWTLERRPEVLKAIEDNVLREDDVDDAEEETRRFLETCFDGLPVEDLCRDFALEHEGLGMAALEVIRRKNATLHGLKPISFENLNILNKEQHDSTKASYIQIIGQKTRYFVNFNENVLFGDEKDPGKDFIDHEFDPITALLEEFPKTHEEREAFVKLRKSHVKADDGTRTSNWPADAATELIVLPRRPFTASSFYGTPAGIQAMGSVLAMRKIQDYNLQFFAAKGVPQYAVIIKGLSAQAPTMTGKAGSLQNSQQAVTKMREVIREFFTKKITAADRSILVVSTFGDAEIIFEKLSSDSIEGSFKEYETREIEKIRMSHRVPGPAVGILETANLGGGRDTVQMMRYRDHIVIPGQRQLATMVNGIIRAGLLVPYFDFKYNPIDLNEEEALRGFYKDAYVAGLISPDEARARIPGEFEELGEEKGGDTLYLRTGNVTTINSFMPFDDDELVRSIIMKDRKIQKEELLRRLEDDDEDEYKDPE